MSYFKMPEFVSIYMAGASSVGLGICICLAGELYRNRHESLRSRTKTLVALACFAPMSALIMGVSLGQCRNWQVYPGHQVPEIEDYGNSMTRGLYSDFNARYGKQFL